MNFYYHWQKWLVVRCRQIPNSARNHGNLRDSDMGLRNHYLSLPHRGGSVNTNILYNSEEGPVDFLTTNIRLKTNIIKIDKSTYLT